MKNNMTIMSEAGPTGSSFSGKMGQTDYVKGSSRCDEQLSFFKFFHQNISIKIHPSFTFFNFSSFIVVVKARFKTGSDREKLLIEFRAHFYGD
jgi:hypothetical protein